MSIVGAADFVCGVLLAQFILFTSTCSMRDNSFEWDGRKAATNLKKHEVSFDEAQLVFDDPHTVDRDEPGRDEERTKTFGRAGDKLLVVVWPELKAGTAPSAAASSAPERQLHMKKTHTGTAKTFARTKRLSDAEIIARAATDPDNSVSTPEELKDFRRTSMARQIRLKLGLSQPEFAKRFGIPLGTLRDWEQHRAEPDRAAQTLLRVIEALPKEVRKVVEAA